MIKRTLVFQSRGYLHLRDCQLVWTPKEGGEEATVPIEDIGFLLLDSQSVTLSTGLLQALTEANAAVVVCDHRHMPAGYLLPLSDHSLATRYLQDQIALTEARRNRLWKQVVQAKLRNQARAIRLLAPELERRLRVMADDVKNGDPENLEGQAARLYFSAFVRRWPDFNARHSDAMPNPALDYGYALLRAAVARAIVSSGLQPALGLHHHNQYNAFCLADDLMEPYRPFVDELVICSSDNLPPRLSDEPPVLDPAEKRRLLPVLVRDVQMESVVRPLMNAISITTASLVRAIRGIQDALELPSFPS